MGLIGPAGFFRQALIRLFEEVFSEEQIIGFLREPDACMAIKELCRPSRGCTGSIFRRLLSSIGHIPPAEAEAAYYAKAAEKNRRRDSIKQHPRFPRGSSTSSRVCCMLALRSKPGAVNTIRKRPKKALGRLTPSAYAKQMAMKADTINLDLLLKAGGRWDVGGLIGSAAFRRGTFVTVQVVSMMPRQEAQLLFLSDVMSFT